MTILPAPPAIAADGFDFEAAVQAPFRMQPGLRRRADGAPLLTPADPQGPWFAAKAAVLRDDPASALLAADGVDCSTTLARFAEALAAAHPAAWRVDGPRWSAPRLGWSVDGDLVHDEGGAAATGTLLRGLEPAWRRPALLALAFEEDLAVVDGATATLPWLAVALPSHWTPADKIGRHFAQVHAPVADNRVLLAAGAHLLKLVTGPARWERFVWTVTAQPGLDAHPARGGARWPADPAAVAAAAHWRTEHQTFWPTGDGRALFTIHVQVQPLADAVASPERAAALHAAIGSMSDAVLAYRSLAAVRGPLLAWLADRA